MYLKQEGCSDEWQVVGSTTQSELFDEHDGIPNDK